MTAESIATIGIDCWVDKAADAALVDDGDADADADTDAAAAAVTVARGIDVVARALFCTSMTAESCAETLLPTLPPMDNK
jgi:hypothetical protein